MGPRSPTSGARANLVEAHHEFLRDQEDWASQVIEGQKQSARKLVDQAAALEDFRSTQASLNASLAKELQGLSARLQELHEGQAAQQLDEARQAERRAEAVKDHAERTVQSALKEMRGSVRDLEAETAPKLCSMQRTVEDLWARQSEITAGMLPSWRTEVAAEVHQLRNAIAQQKDELQAAVQAAVRSWSSKEAEVTGAQARMQDLLTSEFSQQRSYSSRAEARAEEVAGELVPLRQQVAQQSEDLATARQQIQQQIPDVAALESGLEEMKHQYGKLELICQHLSFEGTCMRQKHAEDLSAIRASLDKGMQHQQQQLEGEATRTGEALHDSRKALEDHLSAEVARLSAQIDTRGQRLEQQLKEQATNHAEEVAQLSRDIQAKAAQVDKSAKAADQELLRTIRANEDEAFVPTEAFRRWQAVLDEAVERRADELAERISRENAELQSRAGAVESAILTVQDSARRSVEELAHRVRCDEESQAQVWKRVQGFEALITAMEIRMWPWRQNNHTRPKSSSGARTLQELVPSPDAGRRGVPPTPHRAPSPPRTPEDWRVVRLPDQWRVVQPPPADLWVDAAADQAVAQQPTPAAGGAPRRRPQTARALRPSDRVDIQNLSTLPTKPLPAAKRFVVERVGPS